MADQRKVTLRATHATPKNIILRELPVATPSAGTTIYLYQTHATPKNIILRNPLVLDAPATGVEALSGIATLTLTASGNLTSVTSLSGTATLAITASGELVSTTSLSGEATLALEAVGNLTVIEAAPAQVYSGGIVAYAKHLSRRFVAEEEPEPKPKLVKRAKATKSKVEINDGIVLFQPDLYRARRPITPSPPRPPLFESETVMKYKASLAKRRQQMADDEWLMMN